jgi:hypothetical protein
VCVCVCVCVCHNMLSILVCSILQMGALKRQTIAKFKSSIYGSLNFTHTDCKLSAFQSEITYIFLFCMNQTCNGSFLQTVDNIYACYITSVLFPLSAVFGMWPLHKMQLHCTFQIMITHIAKVTMHMPAM